MTSRGVQFDTAFFKELCAQLGIKPSMTTTFHPQANGGTERVNQEVQLYLSIFCINNPSSWSRALKKAEFIYNNRPHANWSQTPFELMYGQAPLAMLEAFGHSENPSVETRIAQLNQWQKDTILAHEHAREHMKTHIWESYTPFAKGDKVWLEARNLICT
jgi:transposase InsO family protein